MKYAKARPEKVCVSKEGGCDFGSRGKDILCTAPQVMNSACKAFLPAYTEQTQLQRVEFLQIVLRELHHVLKHGDSHDIEDLFHELVQYFPDVAESFTFLLNDCEQVK